MYVWVLNLCVIACQFLFPDPVEVQLQKKFVDNTFIDFKEKIQWVPPEWMNETCNYCYNDWKDVYVQNAFLYTNFLLFTRETGNNFTQINFNDTKSLFDAGFKPTRKTIIVIHGWFNTGYGRFAQTMQQAYLAAEDLNVISVSWPTLAFHFYTLAVTAVKPVGRYTAQLVDFLVNEVKVSPDSIHVLGHSLGAHVAGNTGEAVTFGNLSRITGLDPAGPLFTSDPDGRLDSSDAEFVDVIHSCAGLLGYSHSLGSVDFYPNGGLPYQPGCFMDIVICAHRRSYRYYAESISSKGFIGTSCDSWKKYKNGTCVANKKAIMGEFADPKIKGDFYLHTNSESPFAAWNDSVFADFNFEE